MSEQMTIRAPVKWSCVVGALPVAFAAYLVLGGITGILTVVAAMALAVLIQGRVCLRVGADGIEITNWLSIKRLRWSEIDGFDRMPLSSGRPGRTGAVVVGTRSFEILAIAGPCIDENIGWLNEVARMVKATPASSSAVGVKRLSVSAKSRSTQST